MRPEILVTLVVGAGAALYYLAPRRKAAAPAREPTTPGEAPPPPRPAFDDDANLAYYAARFHAGDRALEPEHVVACALFDPRVQRLLRTRRVSLETARADLRAALRHGRVEAAEERDLEPGEEYAGAKISIRMLVSSRRASEIAAARGASAITLGDLLRAFRERGGVFADLVPAEDEALAPLDVVREVDVSGRARADDAPYRSAGRVDVYTIDDDRTTMDAVMSILGEHFDLDPARAAYAMLETHEKGHGYVGTYDVDEARARVGRATAAARADGSPLRFATFVADATAG